MPETPPSQPPEVGAIRTDSDGTVHIFDGEKWVRHERLSDLGPLTVLRGEDPPAAEAPKGGG
jgi:hypothetical protein